MASAKKEEKLLTYKGRALTRKDKVLYYGSMADKYIIMLQVTDDKDLEDIKLATRVSLQLQLTDPTIKSKDRIVKKTETDGLYQAMDIAAIWLERALKDA
ncbi:MAG: hypothetical protein IJ949_06310 [Oscillospiraceae bacterium]|nr:hypothetical protein [Oscillospiraceae bacterium]MBQ2743649.1 hypothetical protein [Oscillospiraceae bacterium]MBQ7053636.1 hypothetical protein [Oscillospiraceae bacterium]MBR2181486.1 hypothetical protein [Oscillospiraceae bacterium]